MFGKLMSISDQLMWRYFDLLSFKELLEINQLKSSVENGRNPKEVKVLLAKEIVTRFHGAAAADKAHEDFELQFQQNKIPEDLPEIMVTIGNKEHMIALANVLKQSGLVTSTSEALRMIRQKAVKINGEIIEDNVTIKADGILHIYQIGKRKFAKIKVHN